MVGERLSPRIRVPRCQENLIDLEGSESLRNLNNFQTHFKGIIIDAYDFSDDLMMLLDVENAVIKVSYDLDFYNDAGTTEDLTDDYVTQVEETFNIVLDGVTYSTVVHEKAHGQTATVVTNEISEKIIIKGGQYLANVSLFWRYSKRTT